MNRILVAGDATRRHYGQVRYGLYQKGVAAKIYRLKAREWTLDGIDLTSLAIAYQSADTVGKRVISSGRSPLYRTSLSSLPNQLLLDQLDTYPYEQTAKVNALLQSILKDGITIVAVVIDGELLGHTATASWRELLGQNIPWYQSVSGHTVESVVWDE